MTTSINDAVRVDIDEHRWYATVSVERADGRVEVIFFCADGEHSALWMGDRADHEEHA